MKLFHCWTDIPDAPYDVKIREECKNGGTAQVEWIAGSFNNAPTEYFLIGKARVVSQ